jgi:hypothetical protein
MTSATPLQRNWNDWRANSISMLLGGPEAGVAKEISAGAKALLNAERSLPVEEAVASARGILAHGAGRDAGIPSAYRIAGTGGAGGLSKATRYAADPAAWAKAGISSPDIFELAPQDAGRFKEALEAAKTASPYGAAVTVHPDYSGMRIFMTENGKAGFALSSQHRLALKPSDAQTRRKTRRHP